MRKELLKDLLEVTKQEVTRSFVEYLRFCVKKSDNQGVKLGIYIGACRAYETIAKNAHIEGLSIKERTITFENNGDIYRLMTVNADDMIENVILTIGVLNGDIYDIGKSDIMY